MRYLESSFDVLGHADLFQWLQTANKTGVCRVCRDAAIRRIYFKDGGIIACSSNEPRLLLGQFLIANGWIDEVTLKDCMKLQERSGRNAGDLLVDAGKLSETELQRLLTTKAEEVIFGLFEWPHGKLRFEPDQGPPRDAIRVEMNVQAVLVEGRRRQEELEQIRRVFHSPHIVLHKTQRVPGPPTNASYMERKLYESIDGERTLAEIILLCRSSEYLAGSFLLNQVERGLVQVEDRQAPRTHVIDDATSVAQLRALVAGEEYEEAVELIDRCALKSDGDDFLAMLIAKAEAGLLATAYRTQVPPDAVPQRVHPDEPPEKLSSEDLFLLDVIDGHWDVRSLSWIVPMRKIDIVRGLLRLRNYGCIELPSPLGGPEPSRPPLRGDDPVSRKDARTDIERAMDRLGVEAG